MAQRAALGRVTGGIWLQYHTGATGVGHDENIIDGLGRTAMAEGDFTIT